MPVSGLVVGAPLVTRYMSAHIHTDEGGCRGRVAVNDDGILFIEGWKRII